jgi:hypothetical protein
MQERVKARDPKANQRAEEPSSKLYLPIAKTLVLNRCSNWKLKAAGADSTSH